MAMRAICDTCKTEGALTMHGLAPDGWFAVRERGNFGGDGDKDYCSASCAITGLGGVVPSDLPVEGQQGGLDV